MTYLLDTHVLIWAIEFPDKLSARARTLIADEANALLVSAISAFELANKVRLGKLPSGEKLHADYEALLVAAGISSVPVSAAIALRAGRLVADHRDPFDRIIAATSLAADIPLLSIDEALDAFHVRRIW
ncbi:type II toxin-antitoxin system VapC family toxin [Terriglobus aquaticus]|uniref:Type II toxin-antitoxin system VapC family toxin n=1 Tax=Terriglobus aquaticus TaxID=940139 RepID=A0ABW9KKH4_9BACT|nr:type II toxin-antitoxin system VapC family toxin [Terriglobus aquaticus]